AQTFPEDEPIFAKEQTEPLQEQREGHVAETREENLPEDDFEEQSESIAAAWQVEPEGRSENSESTESRPNWRSRFKRFTSAFGANHDTKLEAPEELPSQEDGSHFSAQPELSAFSPSRPMPGTLEEEEIDEEETELRSYAEDVEDDTAFEEMEETTHAAHDNQSIVEQITAEGAQTEQITPEFVADDLTETSNGEAASTEDEIDEEELALDQAQAEAEALLMGDTPETDARAEVRAPATTAGYTQ